MVVFLIEIVKEKWINQNIKNLLALRAAGFSVLLLKQSQMNKFHLFKDCNRQDSDIIS